MDLSEFKLKSAQPYPEVDAVLMPHEAKLLLNSYSGREGELTAVTQYIFQSYILLTEPELADVLRKIAITEMRHHELLGTTIAKLGGYPVMGGNNYAWSGAFPNYASDPKRILLVNIKAEENAIQSYEKLILMCQNEQVKCLLERILIDEELHLNLFCHLLKTL